MTVHELQQKLNTLQDEFETLRDAFLDCGALHREGYLAMLHRRRFQAFEQAHPWRPGRPFLDVLRLQELKYAVTSFMPWLDIGNLLASAKSTKGFSKLQVQKCLLFGAFRETTAKGSQADPNTLSAFANVNHSMRLCDFGERQWHKLPPPPSTWHSFRSVCASTSGVYLLDGETSDRGESGIDFFDMIKGEWSTLPPVPTKRNNPTATLMRGSLYVVGGCVPPVDGVDGPQLNVVERYNSRTAHWEQLSPMLYCREGGVAVNLGNRLYVCGGWATGNLRQVERLDAKGEWEALQPMHQGRGSDDQGRHPMAAISRNCFYVWGGTEYNTGAIECFDGQAGSWSFVPTTTVSRDDIRDSTVVPLGGYLYIFGGMDDSGQFDNVSSGSVERFNPRSGRWESLPHMMVPRVNPGILAAGQFVYAFGGRCYTPKDADWQNLNSVERFDLRSYVWEACTEMPCDVTDAHILRYACDWQTLGEGRDRLCELML